MEHLERADAFLCPDTLYFRPRARERLLSLSLSLSLSVPPSPPTWNKADFPLLEVFAVSRFSICRLACSSLRFSVPPFCSIGSICTVDNQIISNASERAKVENVERSSFREELCLKGNEIFNSPVAIFSCRNIFRFCFLWKHRPLFSSPSLSLSLFCKLRF